MSIKKLAEEIGAVYDDRNLYHWLIDGQSPCLVMKASYIWYKGNQLHQMCQGTFSEVVDACVMFSLAFPEHHVTFEKGICPHIQGDLCVEDHIWPKQSPGTQGH
jgi:hypothetical protein